MGRVVSPMWNLHCTITMPEIGAPCTMPPKVFGYGIGVKFPTKSILYGEMDILAPVSNMMGSRYV